MTTSHKQPEESGWAFPVAGNQRILVLPGHPKTAELVRILVQAICFSGPTKETITAIQDIIRQTKDTQPEVSVLWQESLPLLAISVATAETRPPPSL